MAHEEQAGLSGLIIPVALPPALEALRRRSVPEARHGLPAHITLLYPFVAPAAVEDSLLARVASVVTRHRAVALRLTGQGRWPDVLYAGVEPDGPLRALQAGLAAAFPDQPLYGGAFAFEPHVTVAELSAVAGGMEVDPAWSALPSAAVATCVDLIVREPSGWTVRSRFLLDDAER